jgi:colicin import membrane protein
MRKLVIVGALAALAWAQGVRAEDPEKAKAEAQEKAQKAEAKAGEETREAKAEAQEKTAEANKEMQEEKAEAAKKAEEARAAGTATGERKDTTGATGMMGDEKKHPMFEGKNNYEVKGKIQSVTASSITVHRDEMPAAKLRVDRNTKIELDGERASASQLKEGQEVKASFNLSNDKPMAVEIDAEKMK